MRSSPSARRRRSPGITDKTPQRKIASVAVVGAGTMGGGIAMNFANAGIPVTHARSETGSARSRHRRHPQAVRRRGREGQAQARRRGEARARSSRRRSTTPRRRKRICVIEAVFEDIEREESRVPRARHGHEARCDSRHQHLDARRRPDRRVHEAARRRARHAFLQPGQRHEAARGRAREEDASRCARHGHVARATHRQDRGGLRRLRWLHRQSHDQPVFAAGVAAARGGRVAAAGRSRASRSSASRWGRSACRISRATTSAGTSASVTTRNIRSSARCASPIASASSAASGRRPGSAGIDTKPANATRFRIR